MIFEHIKKNPRGGGGGGRPPPPPPPPRYEHAHGFNGFFFSSLPLLSLEKVCLAYLGREQFFGFCAVFSVSSAGQVFPLANWCHNGTLSLCTTLYATALDGVLHCKAMKFT